MTNWKRSCSAKIARMSVEQAKDALAKISSDTTIHQPVIRALTGGYACQSINLFVLRRLGIKAGFIKV